MVDVGGVKRNSGLTRSEVDDGLAFLLLAFDDGGADRCDEQRETAQRGVLEMVDAAFQGLPLGSSESQRETLRLAWLVPLAWLSLR